jgi:hypothetical protein
MSNSYCQVITSYGLKTGITSAWQTEFYGNGESKGLGNKRSINFGIYAEWCKSSWYSINTELNYSSKGMKTNTPPLVNGQYPVLAGEYQSVLHLNYLSLSILPNIYTEIQSIKIYAFAGPRFDIELTHSSDISGPEPTRTDYSLEIENQLNSYKSFQFGFALGLGVQIKELLPFSFGVEARYNPDITKAYDTERLYIKNNSMDFLLTIEF